METLAHVQSWVLLGLGVVLVCVEAFALVEAIRGSAVMYRAHGKLTKPAWVGLTALATALGFVNVAAPIGLLGILAIVVAGVFLADVRPLVVPQRKNRRNDGPYGPW